MATQASYDLASDSEPQERRAAPAEPVPIGSDAGRRPRTRRATCSESFHVHYSALTVLRDIQTMTSGGKNMFYGGMLGIARRTGLSKETVRVAMNWLVREGWLVREDHEWRNGERRLFTVLTHDQFVEKHGGDSCRQS